MVVGYSGCWLWLLAMMVVTVSDCCLLEVDCGGCWQGLLAVVFVGGGW